MAVANNQSSCGSLLTRRTHSFSITTISQNLLEQTHKLDAPGRRGGKNGQKDFSDIRHRLSLNQLTTLRWSIEKDLQAYQSLGIPAIGVSWRKLLEHGVQRSIRLIRQADIPVSNVSWVGGFTGQNGFGCEEIVLEAKRAIRVAGQLRAKTLTVISGPQNRHIDSHARRLLCSGLNELTSLAENYDVCLCLQPMHAIYGSNWSFLHQLDQALDVIGEIDHSHLKLALGTYHVGDEPDLCGRIESFVERIGSVQLADRSGNPVGENERLIPGEGCLPILEIVGALESAGYNGWYETEVWSQELWKLSHHELIARCLRSQSQLFSFEHAGFVSQG